MATTPAQSEIHLTCVVAGHVDHGKSTLIGCLARQLCEAGVSVGAMDVAVADPAFFTDRLQQERDGRMTVDSAAVRFDLPTGHLTLVDVPGHAEFLRNMMTGATRAASGVLVVAADEGLRPQTEAHARLMAFCGMRRVVLVISKMDLVAWSQSRFDRLRAHLGAFLDGIGIAVATAVPVSAATGANVLDREQSPTWGGGTFLDALQAEMRRGQEAAGDGVPRFAVQDVLRLPNGQRYPVGRVLGAGIAAGQTLWVAGSDRRVEVAGVVRFPEDSRTARPGESVALDLAGSDPPARGVVLEGIRGSTPMARELEASIAWLGEAAPPSALSAQWLYRSAPVLVSVHPQSSNSVWRDPSGLLRIGDHVLHVRSEEPLAGVRACPELSRFVISDHTGLVGAGIVGRAVDGMN